MANNPPRVDGARLWASLEAMAKIGPGVAGGNNRQALTDEDKEGREVFVRWCREAGLQVTVDSMGNVFARRAGEEDLAPVVMGSHLDTQPTGGKYDGVLGVLGGLEVLRTLNALNLKTKHPIEVVNWTNEEGSRFAPSMVSSGVFAGEFEEAWAYERVEAYARDGGPSRATLGSELERIGYKGSEPCGQHPVHAYLELHIEQGPILEDKACDVGVVTGGQGMTWLQVTLTGKESHTGSTPMYKRVNAGLGAARLTELVHTIALEYDGVGAVGHVDLYPNSPNIIPGKAVFTLDFRHPDKPKLDAMEARLRDGAQRVASDLGLGLDLQVTDHCDPVYFDPALVQTVRDASARLGYSHRDIVSGAGHDACWVNKVAPTAMVFTPCVDGLSHNEAEAITPAWAKAGADVLLNAVLHVAGVVSQ